MSNYVGSRLEKALKELHGKINNKKIADKYNITQQSVGQLKKKKAINETISFICQGENINLNWLLTGDGDMLNKPTNNQAENTYTLKKITSYKASAGAGNDIEGVEVYETGEVMHLDKAFLKTPPNKTLRVVRVDGYSMVPMLLPDSWVIFEEVNEFKTDGLYIINYAGQLMVKLLQLSPKGILHIISKNKDYESYEINLKENTEYFKIIGKVIRSII